MVVKGKAPVPLLLAIYAIVHHVNAQSTNSTAITSSNCQPANCPTVCSPSCDIDQVCTKKSMKDCGICPELLCFSRTALGLPPVATTSSVSSNANQNSSNDTGVLLGGILGGLVGLGVLVGIGVYCYLKKKKRGKLPFAFTSGNASHIAQSQEKFQQHPHLQSPQQVTPHPAVIAALSHQSSITPSSSSKYIGLAELASGHSNSQRQRSITSTINTTRFNAIQTPLYNTDNNLNNTNTNTTTTPTTTTPTTTITTSPIISNVPEEFESKIALQNRRISELLSNNPRLSQQPQIQHAEQRYSAYTTTDDEFDDEEDRKSTISASTTQSNYLPQTATATSFQAVQVARAKPQIMRVNSVKTTGGLNRSDSVRTVLTAIDDIQNFPSTPVHHRPSDDNPFEDKHAPNTTQ